jgi:hypothetical protein
VREFHTGGRPVLPWDIAVAAEKAR